MNLKWALERPCNKNEEREEEQRKKMKKETKRKETACPEQNKLLHDNR